MLALRRFVIPVFVVVAVVALSATAFAQGVRHVEGQTGPGSLYVMDVPPSWNGTLVLYAHGIVQADEPVARPSTQDGYDTLRDALLAARYAVASSSFSSNGWSLADAVQRTHQLGKLFASKFGQPQQILLAGHSMGGLAIVKLAEKYPGQYAGALPMCAPLGGALAEIGYAGDARVTFDYYFPGILPGTVFDVPPEAESFGMGTPLFGLVYATLTNPANQGKFLQWVQAARLPFSTDPQKMVSEMGNSAFYVLGFQLRYTNDLIERVNGKIPYDNSTTHYVVAPTEDPATNVFLTAALNDGVERLTADAAALNYYERNYQPTGDISFPVVTLHTTRDPAVPFWHETLYAKSVADAGASDWLTQIPVDAWGHCAFAPTDILGAFNQLVTKVNAAAAK